MYTQEDLNSYVESRLQSPPGSSLWGPAVGVGLPVTAFALGFARTKSGGRVWDVYFKALQHMEGALPMGIGATFRLSEMVSPFASPREFTLSPATHPELFGLVRKNGRVSQAASAFEDYVSRTTGISIHRLKSQGAFEKGFTWTRRGTFLGDLSITGGPVLSTNVAALSTGPRRTGHMFEWFGRVSGVSNAGFLKGIAETEDYLRPTLMPAAAGGSKWSLFGKGLYSVFSAGVGRMNLLLSSPSELPLVQDIAKSVPLLGKIDLGVKPGPGMEMLSRYAGKAAIGLGIYHGIRYADYLGREYGPAASIPIGAATGGLAGAWLGWKAGKGTRYGLIGAALGGVAGGLLGGPISGAAEVYSQADILRAQVSDVTGLGGGARKTEDFFPGMTEPTTLIGAAGVGLLLGGVSDYYQRLAVTRAIGKKRGSLWGGPAHQRIKDIYEAAEGQIKDAAEKQYKNFGELAEKTSGLSKYFTRIRQRFVGYMKGGEFKPSLRAGKGALLGAAAFTGLSIAGSLLSGDIGGAGLTAASAVGAAALYPKAGITGVALALAAPFFLRGKTSSEQLERQYSGEEEVPVKSGRWWEMGRCVRNDCGIRLLNGLSKAAEEVIPGDVLLGPNGEGAVVKTVFSRSYSGPMLTFSSGFNREQKTSLTPNHTVPVLKRGEILAEEIRPNNYVEIPFVRLPDQGFEFEVLPYIQYPVMVSTRKVYSAQRNWATGKLQQSGTNCIPTILSLNKDLGLLTGYFLAEGSLGFNCGNPTLVELAFGKDETRFVEDVIRICQSLFHTTPTVRLKMTGRLVKEGCWIVRICSAIVAKLFAGLFYPEEYDADLKSIPDVFLTANRSFKEGLLEGYWRGDGHLDGSTRVISSAREGLVEQVQQIALSLGRACGISFESNHAKGKWRLRFVHPGATNPPVVFMGGKLFAAIRVIEVEDYSGIVYDFEVDHEDHLYCAGTFLIHNSSFEGRRPYYRPSRVAMMKKGGIQETALYGSEENFWATDPILHPLRFLMDPYAREKLMWQQGYRFPMSKTPFEDFPILGPVLAASFGQIIKPAKFIGREEWLNDPEVEGGIPEGWDSKSLPEPISRTGIKGTIGEQIYRLSELAGLWGFTAQSIKGGLTGNESWFPEDQWATPSIVSGTEPAWWSLELGGAAMSSELLRRFVPHRRNELQYRNPLPSGLPSWLPGPDSMYFLDFSRADVYSKIKEPWARLPGEGLAALHPELKGIAPEEYPDYWRFKILCLDPTTRIHTSTGIREIREVEPGDFVYGSDGELKRVVAKKTKPADGQAYKIRTFYNNDYSLVCSSEHRILAVTKNGEVKELKASELSREHYLLFPKRKSLAGRAFLCIGDYCDVSDTNLKYENGEYWAHAKGSQRFVRFNLPTSYETGRVLGIYLAEGCANSDSQQIIWSFHRDEAETLAREVKTFVEECGLQWYERYIPGSKGYQLAVNNKLLVRFLIQVLGHRAEDKHIGLDLAMFPPEFSLGIMDGYLNGDGNITVVGGSITLRASSVSRELLEQCRLALGLLGITAALRKRKGNYKDQGFGAKGSVIHDAWTLDVKRADIQRLPSYEDTDFSDHQYKPDLESKKFGFETEDYVAFRIKEAVPATLPTEWVDISIEDSSGTHCFLTTAGLVHNSDVAPWSREYGQYDKMMSRMWADNRLTAKQILDIQTTRRQADETKKAKEFEQYRYDNQATEQKTVRITGEAAPGYFTTDTFGSAPISLAGLDISTPALANIAMRENASLTAKEAMSVGVRKRASMARYLREQLRPGAEVQVQINRDRSALMQRGPGDQPVVPAVISVGGQSLNRQLVEMGLAEEKGGAQILDPMAATGVVQRAVGSFWENLMHGAETPLESFVPLAPIAKFVHQRTPLEEYQRSEVYGRDVALWQKPISHFLAPGLSTTAWWGGWRGVPQDVQEKYMVEEYFDRLEYMKWKRLESAARMAGEGRAAATYAGRASRTATGVDPTSTKSAYLSLAKYERMYFEEFVRSPTGAERREISKIVSPQFNRVLHAQWAKREAEQAQMRAEAGVPRVEDPSLMANFEAMRSPQTAQQREQQITQQEAEMPVPGPTWVGWNAGTDMEDYKIKTVDAEGMDLARYGIWGSDLQKIQRKPWVEPISSGFAGDNRTVLSPAGIRRRFRNRTNTLGSGGPNLIPLSDETVRMEIESPGRDRLDRYMRDPSILTF